MLDNNKSVKFIFSANDKEIKNADRFLDKLYGLHPHEIYNTITTSNLSEKEKILVFFTWGFYTAINAIEDEPEE